MKQKHITYRQPKLSTTTKQVSKSILKTSSSAASKITQGLAKHQADTNKTNYRYINVMEAQQSINFIFADVNQRPILSTNQRPILSTFSLG